MPLRKVTERLTRLCMWRQAPEDYDKEHARAQATVMSYTLEAGIIFHSIFIGIGYGASTSLDVVRPLTIALAFHQARSVHPILRGARI